MAMRVQAPEGSYRTRITKQRLFKDDLPIPEPMTKIDEIVKKRTAYHSLKEMCKNRPTLRAPPGSSNLVKKEFALLRKAFKRVTGRDPYR